MYAVTGFPADRAAPAAFPYASDPPSAFIPPDRNLVEKIEKATAEALKPISNLIRLMGFETVSAGAKGFGNAIYWMTLNQDLEKGRIVPRLKPASLNIKSMREFVSALRDVLLIAAVPVGLVAAYAKQVVEYGGIKTFVYPFSKVVVDTFRRQARILLLIREILVIAEQRQAPCKDYLRVFVAASLIVSITLTFFGFTTCALIMGVVSEGIGGCAIVGRYALRRWERRSLGPEARAIEQKALQLREEFVKHLRTGFHSMYETLRMQPDLPNYTMLMRSLEDEYAQVYHRVHKAPNEHVLYEILSGYSQFVREMKAQGIAIDPLLRIEADQYKYRCKELSDASRQREGAAFRAFEQKRAQLQEQYQAAAGRREREAMAKHRDSIKALELHKLSLWTEDTDGTNQLKRYVPILQREKILYEASRLQPSK